MVALAAAVAGRRYLSDDEEEYEEEWRESAPGI
jgi:hypothetical protein